MSAGKCIRCGKYLSRKGQLFCTPYCRYKYHHNGELILPIKRKWFEMILLGVKSEEYREIKPYWTKRFVNYFGRYYNTSNVRDIYGNILLYTWSYQEKTVIFRNGYGKNAPEFTAVCTITEGYGKTEWGAVQGERYYILTIKYIVKGSLKNCENFSVERKGKIYV